MARHLTLMLLGAFTALSLTGCGYGFSPLQAGEGADLGAYASKSSALPKPEGKKAVTFLTYMGLDNNLSDSAAYELNALEWVGSSKNLNALAEVDLFGPKNTFRFFAQKDGFNEKIVSPIEQLGVRDRNSASETTLRNSLKWAFGSYPSTFKWLDFSTHGMAFMGVVTDDRTSSKEKFIAIPALARAIRDGAGSVDLISFNACLMANMEAAYEIRKVAKVMVASEDVIMSYGMNPYNSLKAVADGAAPEADDIARRLVLDANRAGGFPGTPKARTRGMASVVSISALDLTKADRVSAAADQLARILLAKMPQQGRMIKAAANGVKPFAMDNREGDEWLKSRDLNEFAVQLRSRTQDPEIRSACDQLNKALFQNGMVLMARQHDAQQGVARGVSVYLPTDGKLFKSYLDTAFAKETKWDEFLMALGQVS